MNYTSSLGLKKPETTDFYNVGDFNDNMDKLDSMSGRNLLNNPWFTVNQRRASSGVNNQYHVDRWKFITSGTSSLAISGHTLTFTHNGGLTYLAQIGDGGLIDFLNNKTVTASIRSNGVIYHRTFTFVNSGTWYYALDGSDWQFYFDATEKTLCFRISGVISTVTQIVDRVKLELGSTSTLVNDVQPDWGSELVKCATSKADTQDSYSNKVVTFGTVMTATVE